MSVIATLSHNKQHQAPPMLLIHGLGASLGHWRNTIAPLRVDRPVYAVDLLGFGSSDKPVIPYTIDLWVEQVYDFWRTTIQQPIFVGGHSLGGIVALTLAARHPDMVKGLVLVSCADGPHPDTLPPPFNWLVQGFFEGVVGLVSNPITYPWLFNKLREPATLKQCLKTFTATGIKLIANSSKSSAPPPSIPTPLPFLSKPSVLSSRARSAAPRSCYPRSCSPS
ncbi:MAG: alpha/beta fold hydrolase [Synechococcaceae cyanobacterium SM2_3_60]|nr:alpha/beta fold hydrolase [Synechococcaceae cyanobacterium SM2_3_60]